MLERLLAIVRDETQPLWLVDQAMIALSVATPAQAMTLLDTLLPWFGHEEWWLQESAIMALSPALSLPEGLDAILPPLAGTMATTNHTKALNYVGWLLTGLAKEAPPASAEKIAAFFQSIYAETPSQPRPNGDTIDLTGISSWHLTQAMKWTLEVDPALAVDLAELGATRFDDIREREFNRQIRQLFDHAAKLEDPSKSRISQILTAHYRPHIIQLHRKLLESPSAPFAAKAEVIGQLIEIDQLAGIDTGWKSLGNNANGQQQWHFMTWEPDRKPADNVIDRFRAIHPPAFLEDWQQPAYDPAAHGWTADRAEFDDSAPAAFRPTKAWLDSLDSAGEVLFFRKSFSLENLDDAELRIRVHSRQGYRLYLNGHPIITDKNPSKNWNARTTYLDESIKKHLRPGTNVIAATSFLQYLPKKLGGLDVHIETLRNPPHFD